MLVEIQYNIMDFFDEETGFSAMERMTGFPAGIVAIMLARGECEKGAILLEKAISANKFVRELKKREILLEEKVMYGSRIK